MHRFKLLLGFAFAAAAAGALLAVPADRASAHANQVRSSPSPNQVVESSPGRVIVWFSEPIEASFSRIQVLDSVGGQVDNGDSALDPTEPTAMSVTLPADLPNGTYTVAWRNLSTVDGHTVVGSYLFAVGEPVGTGAEVDTSQPLLQTPLDPTIRWAFFVGAMALFGGLLFELVVIGPAFSDATPGTRRHAAAVSFGTAIIRLVVVALVLASAGHIGALFQQAYVTSDSGFAVSALGSVAFESGWGRLWLWRSAALAVAAVAVVLAARARSAGHDDEGPFLLTESMFGQLALVAAAGVLVVTTLASHSAAAPADIRTLATVTDLAHIMAAGAWTGGLAAMVIGLPMLRRAAGDELRSILSESIPRFSTLAMLSAGTLIITGIFSATMQVTVPAATQTPYGWTLVTKVLLIVPLLGLAAYNGFRVARRLGSDTSAPHALRRVVFLEAGVAALVLLAVGWLASLEPARQYASRHGIGVQDAATHTATDSGTTMSIAVAPAEVGANSIRVELEDAVGRPVTTASDVQVRLRSLEQELGEQQLPLNDLGDGAWGAEDYRLSIAGPYQLDLTVVRTDAFDARASFRFEVAGGGAATDAIRPGAETTWTLFGIQVALLGALFLGVASPWLGARATAPRRALLSAGSGLAVMGLLVALNVNTLRVGFAEELTNPFPATAESIEIGRQVYADTCAQCHGIEGRGDGPLAGELDPPPADLIIHIPLHPDTALYRFIRDGVPGTAMPPQEGNLTSDEMWHLVNYLRTLAETEGR